MKGGHRWNAGRPATRSNGKTSDALSLDVRWLHRMNMLAVRGEYRLTWKHASAGICTYADAVALTYRFRAGGETWQDVSQRIPLTTTACTFGGARQWFCCPRCGRRVAILYLLGWPACRSCNRLAYPSQSEDAIGRGWLRQRRIERRLAGGAGEWNHRRPKGMRRATFDRLRNLLWDIEEERDLLIAAYAARLGVLPFWR